MSVDAMSFEQAMSGAERIVARMTGGNCTLDEALPLFEEGMALLARAEAELARIERCAKALMGGPDGTTGESPS